MRRMPCDNWDTGSCRLSFRNEQMDRSGRMVLDWMGYWKVGIMEYWVELVLT